MKKVSVIIPCYNAGKTINQCLNSVINQTYSNLQIITVNDGSKDNTLELLKQSALEDNRIEVHTKENGGVSSARNVGLDESTGDYVCFVDSDDSIQPTMIEEMVNKSISEDADIVVTDYNHAVLRSYLYNNIIEFKTPQDYLKYAQLTFTCVVPWNKLYKKSAIKYRFDEDVHFTEDDLFCIANMFNANKAVGIDKKLYNYQVSEEEVAFEDLSCIVKIALSPNFWETKQTYWYMRMALIEKTKQVVSNYLTNEEDIKDLMYVRAYDFMLCEIIILTGLGVNKDDIAKNTLNIFKEPLFIDAFENKARYGIKLVNNLNDALILKYVDMVVMMYLDITNNKDEKILRPNHVSTLLFAKLFLEQIGTISNVEALACALKEISDNTTVEAQYVNNLCE